MMVRVAGMDLAGASAVPLGGVVRNFFASGGALPCPFFLMGLLGKTARASPPGPLSISNGEGTRG